VYNCELTKACIIQICFKIKIEINIVTDIYITYKNQLANLAVGSPEYVQNLVTSYPLAQRVAALYRRNALAEQNFNNQCQRGLNALNLVIPLYNKLQNLGENTAPELTECQNAAQGLQAAIPYGQNLVNQLNNAYQN
jgi:hypothetical protein